MDAFRIAATDVEAEVTDMMLAEQTVSSARAVAMSAKAMNERSIPRIGSRSALELMLSTSAMDAAVEWVHSAAVTPKRGANSSATTAAPTSTVAPSLHASTAHLGNVDGNDDDDDITSDDSGDFGALTNGLDDAAAYDLVRALIAFDKQQERDIAALRRECGQLEAQQRVLWRRAVTAEQAKQRTGKQHRQRVYGQSSTTIPSGGSTTGVASEMSAKEHDTEEALRAAGVAGAWRLTRATAHDEVIDEEVDEFEDVWLNTARTCRFLGVEGSHLAPSPFRYAEPTVPGDFTTVFDQGFLYRAVTSDGAWVFYNDSEKYMMLVKYRLGPSSTVSPGPKTIMKRLASGEVEVSVEVAPEETEVLIVGEVNGFRSLSVATPVTAAFRNGRVEAHNAPFLGALNTLAAKAKAASVKYLSPEEALTACRQQGDSVAAQLSFVDPEFPPCSSSLYRKDHDTNFLWSEPWRRPSDYLVPADASEVRLFRGQVLPYDPCPGDSGDVYLCSAAAVLAEYPMLVRALFRYPLQALVPPHQEGGKHATDVMQGLLAGQDLQQLIVKAADEARAERRVHAYRLTLNYGGWWTPLLLDDCLPASRKGPSFGRCEDDLRKLWFPLLQKAYAKAHGSYAAIQCGDVAEALQDFTGYPTSRFDEEWATAQECAATAEGEEARNDLYEYLRSQHHDKGYTVCLSLPDEAPETGTAAAAMGLVYGMSYCVLDMVQHQSFDAGTTYRLVKLRCPSVKPGWVGQWCPDSPRWRTEDVALRKLCGLSGGEDAAAAVACDGIWLDWVSEVLPTFEGGVVCHLGFGRHDYRVRGEFNDGIPSVALEVEVLGDEPVEMYCMLSQSDDRGGRPDGPSAALSPLMLCVSKPIPLSQRHPHTLSRAASAAASRPGTASTIREGALAASRRASVAGANGEDNAFTQRKHMVDLVSTTHPDRPSEKFSFTVGRDVALAYTFTPQTAEDRQQAADTDAVAAVDGSNSPLAGTVAGAAARPGEATARYVYYIIPRARGAMQGKAFTLGLLSSTAVDGTRLRVRFVRPNEKCEVFRNRRVFAPERLSTPLASAQFQCRDASGLVMSAWGDQICSLW